MSTRTYICIAFAFILIFMSGMHTRPNGPKFVQCDGKFLGAYLMTSESVLKSLSLRNGQRVSEEMCNTVIFINRLG